MKVVVLYRPNSENREEVEMFIHDFQRLHGGSRLDALDADSREGVAMASLYDVFSFPAILALGDDGGLIKGWEGTNLPLMDAVAYYTQQTV